MSRNLNSFGGWLTMMRRRLDLTTDAAAKRARVHPSMWSDMEHDRRRPSHETAIRVAKAMRIDVDELLARAGILTPAAVELLKKDARVVARLNAQAARRAVAI